MKKTEPAFGARGRILWEKARNPEEQLQFLRIAPDGGKLVCHFTETGSGLVAKDSPSGRVTWCHVAGFDGVFHPADAIVEGNTLIVSSPKVLRPLHVRYAWAKNPEGANLYNKEGFPAPAFRW